VAVPGSDDLPRITRNIGDLMEDLLRHQVSAVEAEGRRATERHEQAMGRILPSKPPGTRFFDVRVAAVDQDDVVDVDGGLADA